MLVLVTKVSVNGKTSAAGGIVINTEFMSEIKTHTSGSVFKYLSKPEDRRGGYDLYVVSETPTLLKAKMNASINATAITLSAYPNNDATQTAEAITFQAKEIVAAFPHTVNTRTKCWLLVNEKGNKVRRYLVAHYYVDIADYVGTGSTTTTTSSTSSTSTTSTSTTSTTTTTTTTT
jgi:hypothetical protein